uniref:Uncharacterized protein n=1 Tax=Eptatretus burgeri TaxID=7764 RepID=A0A8C4QES2_EPTBU
MLKVVVTWRSKKNMAIIGSWAPGKAYPWRSLYHRRCLITPRTRLQMDRRFYLVLNILRHSTRLREVRGGGLVRYVLV